MIISLIHKPMKEIKNLLILILIGVVLYLVWQIRNIEPTVEHHYEYITDTVEIEVPFEPLPTIGINTQPITVYKYPIPTYQDLDHITLSFTDDSLITVINHLQDSLKIHQNFIKLYPENPKLLNLSLTQDSLKLSTLNIQGQVHQDVYPLYLQRYNYNYGLEGLGRTPYNRPSDFRLDYYVFTAGGYSFTEKTPLIMLRPGITLNRLSLEMGSSLYLKQEPTLRLDLALGYKIWGK